MAKWKDDVGTGCFLHFFVLFSPKLVKDHNSHQWGHFKFAILRGAAGLVGSVCAPYTEAMIHITAVAGLTPGYQHPSTVSYSIEAKNTPNKY